MRRIIAILLLLASATAGAQGRMPSITAGILSGGEQVSVMQGGTPKRATVQSFADYAASGLIRRDSALHWFASKKRLADSAAALRRTIDSLRNIAAVPGPTGQKGTNGTNGLPGAKGDKGDPGAAGTNGTNGTAPLWSKSGLLSSTPRDVIDTFSIATATPTITLPLPTGCTVARFKSATGYRASSTASNSPQVSVSSLSSTSVTLVITQSSTNSISLLGLTILSLTGLVSVPDPQNVKVIINYSAY